MAGREFSVDPLTGVKTIFHASDDGESFVLEKRQDVTDIVDWNKAQQNAHTSLDRWGDGKKVASIPMTIYAEWVASGKIHDHAFIKRWLNDPENKHFRTRPGAV